LMLESAKDWQQTQQQKMQLEKKAKEFEQQKQEQAQKVKEQEALQRAKEQETKEQEALQRAKGQEAQERAKEQKVQEQKRGQDELPKLEAQEKPIEKLLDVGATKAAAVGAMLYLVTVAASWQRDETLKSRRSNEKLDMLVREVEQKFDTITSQAPISLMRVLRDILEPALRRFMSNDANTTQAEITSLLGMAEEWLQKTQVQTVHKADKVQKTEEERGGKHVWLETLAAKLEKHMLDKKQRQEKAAIQKRKGSIGGDINDISIESALEKPHSKQSAETLLLHLLQGKALGQDQTASLLDSTKQWLASVATVTKGK